VVTGGSRGIGAAAALALGANGVSVVVVGRDHAAVDNSVAAVRGVGGRALGVIADCTVDADLSALQQAVNTEFGGVDILAAFAGGNGMPVATEQENGAHWREVVETELTSTFLTVSAFLPGMLERNSGVIITMASSAARQAAKSSAAYAAAKAGVVCVDSPPGGRVRPCRDSCQLHRTLSSRERPDAIVGIRRAATQPLAPLSLWDVLVNPRMSPQRPSSLHRTPHRGSPA